MLVEITGKKNEEVLTTTSLEVAKKFEKNHQHILESIDKLTVENSTVEYMFQKTNYKAENGHTYRMYIINRDGFSLLAMGFTGEKALKWKLDYIKAFNAMESELKRLYTERKQWEIEREKGKLIRHVLTDTIKMKVAESPNKRFMYPNYTRLIYKTLFGKPFKELQEYYGIKAKESIREYLTSDQLKDVESMEMLVSSLINCGWGYEQIKNYKCILKKGQKLPYKNGHMLS